MRSYKFYTFHDILLLLIISTISLFTGIMVYYFNIKTNISYIKLFGINVIYLINKLLNSVFKFIYVSNNHQNNNITGKVY